MFAKCFLLLAATVLAAGIMFNGYLLFRDSSQQARIEVLKNSDIQKREPEVVLAEDDVCGYMDQYSALKLLSQLHPLSIEDERLWQSTVAGTLRAGRLKIERGEHFSCYSPLDLVYDMTRFGRIDEKHDPEHSDKNIKKMRSILLKRLKEEVQVFLKELKLKKSDYANTLENFKNFLMLAQSGLWTFSPEELGVPKDFAP